MAEHYGTAIIPARVKKPRDKPVAEGSVRHVAGRIAAVLRNRTFVGLAELNEAIFDEVEQVNARPFQKREDSRLVVFERDDGPVAMAAWVGPTRVVQAGLASAVSGCHAQCNPDPCNVVFGCIVPHQTKTGVTGSSRAIP